VSDADRPRHGDGAGGEAEPGVRERILAAAVRCAERAGVRRFSLEDVALEAGLSRMSIYRHFPGGRAQLVEEAATWEVARFWTRLAKAVEGLDTLEDRLVAGLGLGHRLIARSRVMQALDDSDLDELMAALRPSEPLVHQVICDYIQSLLEAEGRAGRLREGVDVAEAADYLTRMILSTMGSPGGVDLADPDQTRRLVRTQFLGGICT
jgi:AcrR family transcriptional regulator